MDKGKKKKQRHYPKMWFWLKVLAFESAQSLKQFLVFKMEEHG